MREQHSNAELSISIRPPQFLMERKKKNPCLSDKKHLYVHNENCRLIGTLGSALLLQPSSGYREHINRTETNLSDSDRTRGNSSRTSWIEPLAT